MGERTVLLRRSSLGDVLLLGGVTAALKGPVAVVTAPEWAELAARLPNVTEVIPWPRDASVEELARRLPPGRLIDLHVTLRSTRLALASGRPVSRLNKRSWRRRSRVWFKSGVTLPTVVERYAEACGVVARSGPWLQQPRPDAAALAVCPGARWDTKRWRRHAELVRRWDGPVFVLGGPGEEVLCKRVAAEHPAAEVVVERGFSGTLAALAQCRVALTNDSGLMHLAGAAGVRVVAVFGATHPDDGFFCYPGEVVSLETLSCRPCTLHGQEHCPLDTLACMDIGVDSVLAAIDRQWGAACAG